MKKCPYCAEEIQDEAIKCRFCGEMLNKKAKDKWYFRSSLLIIAFLCIGPLALPLLWLKPSLNKKRKIIITVIILIISYYLWVLFANSMRTISAYYQQVVY